MVFLTISAVAILWSLLRFNSAESQILRAVGRGDPAAYIPLVMGILLAITGSWPFLTRPRSSASPAQERLRELQSLKDANLISDDDFQRKKAEILRSL